MKSEKYSESVKSKSVHIPHVNARRRTWTHIDVR